MGYSINIYSRITLIIILSILIMVMIICESASVQQAEVPAPGHNQASPPLSSSPPQSSQSSPSHQHQQSQISIEKTTKSGSGRKRDVVNLQNSESHGCILVEYDTSTGAFAENLRMTDGKTNLDQNNVFIITYDKLPAFGQPVLATMKHLKSGKYVIFGSGSTVRLGTHPYKWTITEVIGGDILISAQSSGDTRYYISLDEANNPGMVPVGKSDAENVGKIEKPVTKYQWKRVIAAHVTSEVLINISNRLGTPIPTID